MEQQDIQILSGLLSGALQPQDTAVQAWIMEHPERSVLLKEPQQLRELLEELQLQQSFDADRMFTRFIREEGKVTAIKPRNRYWYAAAAAALFLGIGSSAFWLANYPKTTVTPAIAAAKVMPFGNYAVLKAGDEEVTLQGRDSSFMLAGNQVQLKSGSIAVAGNQPVNYTLTTPRGANYKITLPDGSVAWLNAASSIIYPAVFTGERREVTITGEIFFEITQQAGHPFTVHSPTQEVEVLGTSFNIRAYAEDKVCQTTLVSGKVQVQATHEKRILQPGEQAVLNNSSQQLSIQQIDTSEVTSWKDGWMRFQGKPLAEILENISRWYDVDIKADQQQLSGQYFTCYINKKQPLGEVINSLNNSTNQFSFSVEKRTILVTEKIAE